ncbi:MAG TPA: hypothetical protein VGY31_06125 [Terriglobia bacterium]|nr:hypothetical protein [Terriglobia bacterium]
MARNISKPSAAGLRILPGFCADGTMTPGCKSPGAREGSVLPLRPACRAAGDGEAKNVQATVITNAAALMIHSGTFISPPFLMSAVYIDRKV